MSQHSNEGVSSALQSVEHIVVLMLENRSFDHMLGYLALDQTYPFDVDGLSAGLENSYDGITYPTFRLPSTVMKSFETPEHAGPHVDVQLSGDGGGFAKDYIESRATAEQKAWATEPDHCVVMGYHDGSQLPAFDHLARHYVVCDRWFSSVRGATMPNRLYSVCGTSGGTRANKTVFGTDFPLYNYPSFVRHLEDAGVSWRWYHPSPLIPPTLKLFDPLFAAGQESHYSLSRDFPADARTGDLPAVTWIDPGFFDKFEMRENDDHPPTDVARGQRLVRLVTNSLMSSPHWETTLLVITYDEHGGFFDHVMPPEAPDDHPETSYYGVRVPTVVVSPFVEPGVSSTPFDHTSIIRTILDRFCPNLAQDVMGTRVGRAENLSALLTGAARPAHRIPPFPHGPARLTTADGSEAADTDEVAERVNPELASMVAESSGGHDLLRRVEKSALAVVAQDPAPSTAAGETDGAAGGPMPAPTRPLDDLQRGLLVAAGEIERARRSRTSPASTQLD